MRVLFKLAGRSKVATLVSGDITETRHDYAEATLPTLSPSNLLYVADKCNKCEYLIDTGAAGSVLPKSCANSIADKETYCAFYDKSMKFLAFVEHMLRVILRCGDLTSDDF